MVKIRNFIFINLLIIEVLASNKTCEYEFDSKNKVVWPHTVDKTLSKPICLNKNKEFIYRTCLNGMWEPVPICIFLQKETLSQCPEGFKETKILCYKLIEKTTFPPNCPFDNTLPFNFFVDMIQDKDLKEPIWVPAKRPGFGFLEWIEASWQYRKEVKFYKFSKPLLEKECLIYFQQNFTLASCNEHYRGVCAYKKLNQIDYNLCNSSYCYQSDFTVKSKCFCKDENNLSDSKAEFIKPYQFSLYSKLTNETCSIGLVKTPNDGYIWNGSKTPLSYTYWSKNATFRENLIFGAANTNGWILTEAQKNCSIFQFDIDYSEPELFLELNESNYHFLLKVRNPHSLKILDSGILLFCFTDADGLHLLFNYANLKIIRDYGKEILYEFEAIQNLSGFYWCEAFKHIDSTIIKTEKIFVRPNNLLEFVGIFDIKYESIYNPLSNDIGAILQNSLIPQSKLSLIHNIRVMKILNLDEENLVVTLNIHLTANIELENASEVIFYYIKNKITENLKTKSQIKLVEFLSSDFCIPENERLKWPRTPLGTFADPYEFCFTRYGDPIIRLCDGDFINGAKWSKYEECEIFNNSILTRRLMRIVQNSSLNEIWSLSEDYQHFSPLDVYLLGKTFSQYLYIPDIVIFANTITNVLKIDKIIIMKSRKLNATDKILYSIDHINFKYHETFEFYSNNFVFISLEAEFLSGLAVIKNLDHYETKKLLNGCNLEDISKIENLEAAIWLSPQFKVELGKETRLTFTIYFKDNFFQQDDSVKTDIIFGITHFESGELFSGPVHLLHRKKHNFENASCAFWGYSLNNRGSWKSVFSPKNYSHFLLCDYWYSANYAITSPSYNHTSNSQVTNKLINLLESNTSAPEMMTQLSDISEQFSEFEPVDLAFVGQILGKVSTIEADMDFGYLASTISNLQEINRDILNESQVEEAATDTILANVDAIIETHSPRSSFKIITNNFIILTFKQSDNILGVALINEDGVLEPLILYSNISVTNLIKEDYFNSAVVLSYELLNQIPKNTKISITIYFKDSLFNEKYSRRKQVNTIFGVILPPIGKYQGPVTIYYKNSDLNETPQCSYWNFDRPKNLTGFWKHDGYYMNKSNYFQCNFWHTTHFTYLIMDASTQKPQQVDVLGLLTTINCIISLLSLIGIILTAVFFKQWRENTGNQILLNFTFAIIIQILIFYTSNLKDRFTSFIFCTIIGIVLHYSIVSQFCWMFVIAILQFRRFVIVFDDCPKFILLKSCVCGWGLPLLPVICVFASDKYNYVHSKVGLCYPSGLGLYLGVWLPVSVIISINFVLFTITLYNVLHKKTECVIESGEAIYQWRLAVSLFFMLGFNWCFGFLAELEFGIVFEYLFCITSTLQGFILFVFFIICNENTRYLYVTAVSKAFKRKFK